MLKKSSGVAALILCVLLTACSTWTALEPDQVSSALEAGDQIRVVTRDGTHHELEVAEVTSDGEIRGSGMVLSAKDLTLIERRDIDAGNTALTIVGGILIGAILFATVGFLNFISSS